MSEQKQPTAAAKAEKKQQEAKGSKNQNFLQGAAILTIAVILVKLIGALYKIPMNRIIGTEGFGHFNVAYSIYNVLLMISSTGLPIAVSRMISEAKTLGSMRQVQKIYQTSLKVFMIIGVVCFGAMFLCAKQLAVFMDDPDSWYAIAALSPAVLFVCIICSFRGYFQGQAYMTPTAISEVIEASCKLIVGLGAVILLMKLGFGIPVCAGGAILGVTCGTIGSATFLIIVYRKRRVRLTEADMEQPVTSTLETTKQLLHLAVPITIGSAGLQIFNALDTKIILNRLQKAIGMSSKAATSMFGIYSAAQTFYMLPSALIQPLAVSVIPHVTRALTLGDLKTARKTEESAIRMTALLGLPMAAGLAVLSSPIQRWLYDYDNETLSYAGPILAILGVAVIFNCMVTVTNAILQAHGRVRVPMVTTLIGGLINIITDYVFISMQSIQIFGAAIATIAYCAAITFLNVFAMHRALDLPPRILKQFIKPLIATAVMAVSAYLSYEALLHVLNHVSIAVLGSVCVAACVYAVLVFVMKIVTWDDCQLLPKSELIARLLRVSPPADDND